MKNIVIKNEEERIVSGIIAEPMVLDTDNEFFSRSGIFKMYSDFISLNLQENIDREHDNNLTGSEIIRTYIALKNDPDNYPEGAWIGECKINSDSDWEAVKQGKINGYSVEISTIKVDVNIAAERMIKAVGTTELSLDTVLPTHIHQVTIKFDENGKVSGYSCSTALGHSHSITKCTATNQELGHSHRLILER